MTAKTLRKEGGTGARSRAAKRLTLRTSGGRNRKKPASHSHQPEDCNSNIDRAIRRLLKYDACKKALADAVRKRCDAEEEHYGRQRDPVVHTAFKERQVGDLITRDRASIDFSCSVVAIALFDGDTMLFACSGLKLPEGESKLELARYVTSACLAREYERKRYRDDKLKVKVRLPNDRIKSAFIELHNSHIAIVTLLDPQAGRPLIFEAHPSEDEMADDEIEVAGRAFESGCLMSAKAVKVACCSGVVGLFDPNQSELPNSVPFGAEGQFYPNGVHLDPPIEGHNMLFWRPVSSCEGGPVAVLGGPVLRKDNTIMGMNIDIGSDGSCASFITMEQLWVYLVHFGIFNLEYFRPYSLPEGVHTWTITPSAFIRKIYRLRHLGYPMPPPLMLELNGKLLNQFEDLFGDVRAWKGYPFGSPNYCAEPVWRHLRKDVVKNISRRVVSIASFHGYERYFVCTGLLIKWHGRTVVLTSASLFRRSDYEDKIYNDLKIEVFLPPKQRANGKLELYSLKYNIAIVSLEKKFISICPENISRKYATLKPYEKVVAVGSEPLNGLLMASIGKVKPRDKDCKLDCKDLKLSTCKIWKAGIGGPLIDLDGSFVGMNFFDGRKLTPFLPRSKIVQVLRSNINLPLPSERGVDAPVHVKGARQGSSYRWPVPEPYWYHGLLDVHRNEHKHIGRVLQ